MSAKTHGTCEDTPLIDSFDVGSDYLLVYNSRGKTTMLDYLNCFDELEIYNQHGSLKAVIPIETTSGIESQTFFKCPCCGKRQRFLYIMGAYVFKCRRCAKLNYRCQQDYYDSIAIFRAGMQYAAERLGWIDSDALPVDFPYIKPEKPKYMHKSTYQKIMRKFKRYQSLYQKKHDEELERVMAEAQKEARR